MKYHTLEITEQPEGLGFTGIRKLVNQTLGKNFGEMLSPVAIPTGFKALDKCMGGLKNGHLYTVAVRPGMGKTAFLLSLTNNLAIKENNTVAIFSSERSDIKMTRRLIESETGMSIDKLVQGQLKDSQQDHLLSLLATIAKSGILIDDTPALSVEELTRKTRQLARLGQADIVIIDYLELLTSTAFAHTDKSARQIDIIRKIGEIARETGIPIVLFTQAMPQINGHDLSGSPSAKALPAYLHEASDVVILLHRNDAFDKPQRENKSNVELMVSQKGAQGMETLIPLHFIESIAKFTDHN